MDGELFRGAMTKAKLMSLQEGCWIVSGVSHNDGTPILTTRVGDLDSRAELWAREEAAEEAVSGVSASSDG